MRACNMSARLRIAILWLWTLDVEDHAVSETYLPMVAAGHMAAMQECIDHYGPLIWSLARRFSANATDAEDAVQEAFIQAFRGLKDFEGRSTIETWLHRIPVNAALAKLRQLKRLSEQSMDEHLS